MKSTALALAGIALGARGLARAGRVIGFAGRDVLEPTGARSGVQFLGMFFGGAAGRRRRHHEL